MKEENKSITERIYRNLIVGDSIKKQALITGEFNILASLTILLVDFPFSKNMAFIALAASLPYFVFYIFYEKIPERCFIFLTSLMSFFAFFVLFFVIHLSGGITSPFIFLYFCVYVFENMGGITGKYSLYFGVLSYLSAVMLEFFGIIPSANQAAKAIYSSPSTTFIISLSTVSFMATVSYSTRLIYENVKNKLSEEVKEREELLLKYSHLEKQANLGLISHKVIHDMRTPLTLIKNYIIMARKSEDIRNDEKKFSAIQNSIDKLSESMEAIISYVRKGQDYNTRITDICDAVEKTITVIKFYSSAVKYEISYENIQNKNAYFNPNEFYTVIFNLLKNAIDALESSDLKEKNVKIKCYQKENFLFAEIFNNGPVFPKNMLELAFKESFTTKKDGSGLGLMIVRDLCDQNDAEVKIENKGEKYGVLVTLKLKKIGD